MNTNLKAMKKLVLVLIGATLMFSSQAGNFLNSGGDEQKSSDVKGSMTISSTPDLFKLATGWASEYSVINPKIKINVVSLADQTGDLSTGTGDNLAFISNESNPALVDGSKWKMVIGRDAIVPVMNSSNPYLAEIIRQGISAAEFAGFFNSPDQHTWANLLEGGKNVPVNFYMPGDESIKSTLANFAGINSNMIRSTEVAGGPEMIAAIQNDPMAIGFCKLADITDLSGQNLVNQISLLPIDKNANGRMDYIEKIYENVTDLSRGIWIGKYPKELCRNLYVIAPVKPTGDEEVAFLKYVLSAGQQFLDMTGFNSLNNTERLSKIDRLPTVFLTTKTSNGINYTQLIITILAGLIFIAAVIAFILRYRRANSPVIRKTAQHSVHSISQHTMEIPKGLFFDKTHTWAFMEKDGTVKVGIDDFLQHVTGKITSIKLKNRGDKVIKGEPVLTIIQNGKRLTISSPCSGIIRDENLILFTDPSLLNSAPYTQGWIYLMEPTNWMRETQFLFMSEKYSEWLKKEFSRLRDFLAHAIKPDVPEYAYVILQDGGEITDHLLENLGPEVWEEFQTNFIEATK